ncbi:MAG: zinc ribbon domain-containing protein [Desulfobacteraceae bacterium]|nr:zinc ribbon domain-containing protein [Desulfobacteraceae bacterium]
MPHCSVHLEERFRFCPLCGGTVTPRCADCGKLLASNWRNCPFCGKIHITGNK